MVSASDKAPIRCQTLKRPGNPAAKSKPICVRPPECLQTNGYLRLKSDTECSSVVTTNSAAKNSVTKVAVQSRWYKAIRLPPINPHQTSTPGRKTPMTSTAQAVVRPFWLPLPAPCL